MKKIFLTLCVAFASIAMYAAGLEGVKIYINPGHGSWSAASCRGLSTIPYQMDPVTTAIDTCGFFESNTNLWKSLELGKKLEAAGAVVTYSRTKNGPYPFTNRTEYDARADRNMYDRNINEIAEEVEANGYDYFISIHSNANYDGALSNFPIILYRGYDNKVAAGDSKTRGEVLWPYLFEAMESGIDPYTNYSKGSPNVRGDISFMNDSVDDHVHPDGQIFVGYYAVLRHSVPGYLSEGYFHTYQPARHRALNEDYCRQEGVRYYRGIAAYYNHPAETKGYIMGTVKDLHEKMNHSLYTYNPGTNDVWVPCNGAVVTLYKGETKISEYNVDTLYNGVFVFSDLEPGNDYWLDATCEGYKPLFDEYKEHLTVKANETTYPLIFLESETYDPNYATTDELNIYAYGLSLGEVADGKAKISYTLNARALSLEFQVVNEAGEVVKAVAITDPVHLKKGAHTDVEVSLAGVPNGTHNWLLKVGATERTEVSADFVEGLPGYSFYQPRGLEVNVNPENEYFGYTYLANSDQGTPAGQSAVTVSGIHIFNPLLENQGGYTGGVTWVGTQKAAGVAWQQREKGAYRVQLDEKGNVYVNDNYSATTGIWVMDPANPEANFTSVLDREKAKTTVYNCFEVVGEDADRKLVTFESQNKFLSYAIGEQTGYTGVGTVWKEYAAGTDLTSLESDGRGGFWFIRAITESGDKACLVHFNAEGVEDYSLKLAVSTYATMNLNKDKSLLALSHNTNDVNGAVYAVTWADGVPALTEKYTFQLAIKTNHITALAFDYANNLYVGSHYSERFHAYALPSKNVCATPAPKASVLTVENAIEDVTDELNVYASGLTASEIIDGKIEISYTLNARALSLEFQVLNATGEVVKTIPLNDAASLAKGAHEGVVVDLAGIPTGLYTWALEASATKRTAISSDLVAGLEGYSFYQPRGLEVNVNPENEYFGYTYLTNSDQGNPSATPSTTTVSGIHVYDPQLVYQGGYTGGVTWVGTQKAAGVAWQEREKGAYRVQLDENGYVYANDNYSATSGIWVMDPANPEADFTPVLAADKSNYTTLNCFEIVGEGADRKLITLDGATKFLSYAIGEQTGYTAEGTVWKEYAAGTDLTSLESDGKGGFWFIRAITESGDNACLVHFNAAGTEDYSLKLSSSTFATLNLNKDKTLLALSHNDDKLGKVYSIAWVDGVPALTEQYTFNLGTNYITAVAFDYANNLYVGSHYSERFHAFALPTDNTCTTPAPKASVLNIGGIITNLENAEVEQVQVRKVIENGMLVIIKDGVRYNVMGVRL